MREADWSGGSSARCTAQLRTSPTRLPSAPASSRPRAQESGESQWFRGSAAAGTQLTADCELRESAARGRSDRRGTHGSPTDPLLSTAENPQQAEPGKARIRGDDYSTGKYRSSSQAESWTRYSSHSFRLSSI